MTTLAVALLVLAPPPPDESFWEGFRAAIHRHLGRPYVWGASGLKGFDCSGFVWRVMWDNGVLVKRTTARKLYMSLPKAKPGQERQFGNLVFFDNLKHCGIVNERESFYHAATTQGTSLAQFAPYWQPKVCGYRRIRRE